MSRKNRPRRRRALEVTFDMCLDHNKVEVMVTPRHLYSVTKESGESDRRRGGNEEVKGADLLGVEKKTCTSFCWDSVKGT